MEEEQFDAIRANFYNFSSKELLTQLKALLDIKSNPNLSKLLLSNIHVSTYLSKNHEKFIHIQVCQYLFNQFTINI